MNTENYNVKNAGYALHNKNYNDVPWQTAGLDYADKSSYKDVSNNVYDLEGNVYEWTTESDFSDYRVSRGRLLHLQQFS